MRSFILAASAIFALASPARAKEATAFAAPKMGVHGSTTTAKTPPPADEETVKMVDAFVSAPTASLPADHIPRFLAIDPQTLPKRLQARFKAKSLELYTLKQLADGKKKGAIRTPEKDCSIPTNAKSQDVTILKMAGFDEMSPDDLECVKDRTKCTERDMMCEFSLQILVLKRNGQKFFRFFLSPSDPLMGVVAGCRGRGVGGQTNFFGMGAVVCSH